MREIKFRAWVFYDDKGTRKMINVGAMRVFGDFAYVCDENGDEFQINTPDLSQYTGLLDRTGREIYEGDILKGNVIFNPVKWDEEWLVWTAEGGINRLWPPSWKKCEVIGNIYENPDLLK